MLLAAAMEALDLLDEFAMLREASVALVQGRSIEEHPGKAGVLRALMGGPSRPPNPTKEAPPPSG